VDHQRSTENELTLLAATLQWNFDNFTLKSITGYGESEYLMIQDGVITESGV
jgi:hypothetical protein